ncbi:spexin-like isoform X1 [Solea senegalensis]|uniref:Spexin-like isoform X1 n=1 Tax=Solea senegalensis TaxID=28829 RepID=A0AAV6PI64_SOLSE|nr:spexin-like isoform X1 [Solea senegalensis]
MIWLGVKGVPPGSTASGIEPVNAAATDGRYKKPCCCETHTVIGLTTLTQADMKIKAPVVWTCSFVISLLVGSCHAQKLNIHWGPQSMMYLKGKFGRRFVSEDENSLLKQALHGWYTVLKGIAAFC